MKYNKDKNSVVILINKIEKNKAFSNSFRILKIYEIENHEKAAVTVYDYYRPSKYMVLILVINYFIFLLKISNVI